MAQTGNTMSSTIDAQPALGRDFRSLLGALVTLDHITGGLIVAPDGLLIAAQLPGEIAPEPLSALAAMLGRELERRGPRLRRATFPMARFASGTGTVFLGSTLVGYIVLLGDASADWDTIRSALRAAVGTVHRAWAG
jgi:predicted regulator of Ras-like GTPase activity (Roadblock/LC7/MglB family)